MKDRSDIVIDAAACCVGMGEWRRTDSNFVTAKRKKWPPSKASHFFRPTCELVDHNAHAGRRIRRCRCRAADDQLIGAKIKRCPLRTKSSILVANLIGSGIRNERLEGTTVKPASFAGLVLAKCSSPPLRLQTAGPHSGCSWSAPDLRQCRTKG